MKQSGVRPLEFRRRGTRRDVFWRGVQRVLERPARVIPMAQHAFVAAAAEEHPPCGPCPDRPDPLGHHAVAAGDCPATVGKASTGVLIGTCRALDDPVEADMVEYDDVHWGDYLGEHHRLSERAMKGAHKSKACPD